jgi:hypothetical protein
MTAGQLNSVRAHRGDTLIAALMLVALVVGWVLNFVPLKEVPVHLDSLVAAATRWA